MSEVGRLFLIDTGIIFSPFQSEMSVDGVVVIRRSPQGRFRALQQMIHDQNLVLIATDHFVSIG